MTLAITYAVLAMIATAANIAAQEVALRLYTGMYHTLFSVSVGTAVGLVVKYMLDKAFIFHFRARSVIEDGQIFVLYTLSGIFTTVIFWGCEFGFDWMFHSKEWRYAGGVLGLAIGYVTKYHMDKRFVFGGRTARC